MSWVGVKPWYEMPTVRGMLSRLYRAEIISGYIISEMRSTKPLIRIYYKRSTDARSRCYSGAGVTLEEAFARALLSLPPAKEDLAIQPQDGRPGKSA